MHSRHCLLQYSAGMSKNGIELPTPAFSGREICLHECAVAFGKCVEFVHESLEFVAQYANKKIAVFGTPRFEKSCDFVRARNAYGCYSGRDTFGHWRSLSFIAGNFPRGCKARGVLHAR